MGLAGAFMGLPLTINRVHLTLPCMWIHSNGTMCMLFTRNGQWRFLARIEVGAAL